MNLDIVIKEMEEREKRYLAYPYGYNLGYAHGLHTLLVILYRIKDEGIAQ